RVVDHDFSIHVDALYATPHDAPEFIVIANRAKEEKILSINVQRSFTGLFSQLKIGINENQIIPAGLVDIFI
ncbi:MAG: hypothetical protein JXR78_14225, partial [Victivallales bacterium]|nr:hypothetical protein [Victivallales bacterium]